MSSGFRCPECFQKGAQKQEQQAKAGVLTNIPALGGSACDRENTRWRGCGVLLWDTEGRGGERLQRPGGGAISAVGDATGI